MALVDYRKNKFCRVCQKPRELERQWCPECGRRLRKSSKSSKGIHKKLAEIRRIS